MKRHLLIFLIIIESFFIILFFKKINNKAKTTSKQIISEINKTTKSLSPLYADKNLIRRSDNHQIVILKGVTTQLFGYLSYSEENFWNIFGQIKDWKINLIGVFITPLTINEKNKNLDLLVKKTEENGIYIYLTPTLDGRITNPLPYVKNFPSFIGSLAKRYQSKKHIIYGVWAEPHNISWSDYLELVKKTIKEVRKYNKKAIIIINGIDWGSTFDNLNDLSQFNNIILSYHYYPAKDKIDLKNHLQKNEEFPWKKAMDKFPILIGEFGGVYEKDFGSDEDLIFIKKVLENINKNGLSYTAYTIDDEGEISLFNHLNFSLKKKGEIIKNDIKKFPPTKF